MSQTARSSRCDSGARGTGGKSGAGAEFAVKPLAIAALLLLCATLAVIALPRVFAASGSRSANAVRGKMRHFATTVEIATARRRHCRCHRGEEPGRIGLTRCDPSCHTGRPTRDLLRRDIAADARSTPAPRPPPLARRRKQSRPRKLRWLRDGRSTIRTSARNAIPDSVASFAASKLLPRLVRRSRTLLQRPLLSTSPPRPKRKTPRKSRRIFFTKKNRGSERSRGAKIRSQVTEASRARQGSPSP